MSTSLSADGLTQPTVARRKTADRIAVTSFGLAVVAVVVGTADYVWFSLVNAVDGNAYATAFPIALWVFVAAIIVAAVAAVGGIAALRLRSLRRALAGAATGIGIVLVVVTVVFTVTPIVINSLLAQPFPW